MTENTNAIPQGHTLQKVEIPQQPATKDPTPLESAAAKVALAADCLQDARRILNNASVGTSAFLAWQLGQAMGSLGIANYAAQDAKFWADAVAKDGVA